MDRQQKAVFLVGLLASDGGDNDDDVDVGVLLQDLSQKDHNFWYRATAATPHWMWFRQRGDLQEASLKHSQRFLSPDSFFLWVARAILDMFSWTRAISRKHWNTCRIASLLIRMCKATLD